MESIGRLDSCMELAIAAFMSWGLLLMAAYA